MREVIARCAKEVKQTPKILLILGIVSFVLGIVLLLIPFGDFHALNEYKAEIFAAKFTALLCGPIFIIWAIVLRVRAKNAPTEIITLNDGVLNFSDGFSCKIEEVSTVRCTLDVDGGTLIGVAAMGMDTTGSLTVVVGGNERVYRKIENVTKVNDRLIELMLKSRERTSVKLDFKENGDLNG